MIGGTKKKGKEKTKQRKKRKENTTKKENQRTPNKEGYWKSIQGHTQRQALRGGERKTEMNTESV